MAMLRMKLNNALFPVSGTRTVIGRSMEADVVVDIVQDISRQHCAICLIDDGSYLLEDFGSHNGTLHQRHSDFGRDRSKTMEMCSELASTLSSCLWPLYQRLRRGASRLRILILLIICGAVGHRVAAHRRSPRLMHRTIRRQPSRQCQEFASAARKSMRRDG